MKLQTGVSRLLHAVDGFRSRFAASGTKESRQRSDRQPDRAAQEVDKPQTQSRDEDLVSAPEGLARAPAAEVPQSPLEEAILEAVAKVIDPGTFVDVVSMGLIRELHAGDDGRVEVTFRPSSPVCPLAFKLGADIQEAAESVEGVTEVFVKVDGFVHAEQLMQALNE